jgi:hypothetical protein
MRVAVAGSIPAPPIRRRLLAIVGSLFGLFVMAACGGHTAINGGLNALTVHDILASIGKAGLAVPNPRDVTQSDCPQIGCANKVETDTVSIIKFPIPGRAQFYAGSTEHTFQIEDVVMTFTSLVRTNEQLAYEGSA